MCVCVCVDGIDLFEHVPSPGKYYSHVIAYAQLCQICLEAFIELRFGAVWHLYPVKMFGTFLMPFFDHFSAIQTMLNEIHVAHNRNEK